MLQAYFTRHSPYVSIPAPTWPRHADFTNCACQAIDQTTARSRIHARRPMLLFVPLLPLVHAQIAHSLPHLVDLSACSSSMMHAQLLHPIEGNFSMPTQPPCERFCMHDLHKALPHTTALIGSNTSKAHQVPMHQLLLAFHTPTSWLQIVEKKRRNGW